MTPQEAIQGIKFYKEKLHNGIFKDNIGAFDIAISVLEKQIPKKSIIDTNYSGGRYTVGICPNCKKLIGLLHFAKDFKCCSECGQALDWGEE